jgi:carbonic anhydrase/acetyltransferase-like protein (isoleucine patch superfamily)
MRIYYKNEWIDVNTNDERVKELSIRIREGAYIGERADIGERAGIGAGADIGAGAYIGEGAYIDVIISKYCCNRYFDEKTKTYFIRIGCKTFTLQEWSNIEFQEKLADENDREWWEAKGRKILQFSMGE